MDESDVFALFGKEGSDSISSRLPFCASLLYQVIRDGIYRDKTAPFLYQLCSYVGHGLSRQNHFSNF